MSKMALPRRAAAQAVLLAALLLVAAHGPAPAAAQSIGDTIVKALLSFANWSFAIRALRDKWAREATIEMTRRDRNWRYLAVIPDHTMTGTFTRGSIVATNLQASVRYTVYAVHVSASATFTLRGDGGWINWGFACSCGCTRNGKVVTFTPCDPNPVQERIEMRAPGQLCGRQTLPVTGFCQFSCCSSLGVCAANAGACGAGCRAGFGALCLPNGGSSYDSLQAECTATNPFYPGFCADLVPVSAPGGRCGLDMQSGEFGLCPSDQCCSRFGYCGTTATHCGDGCQPHLGRCNAGRAVCGSGQCCSQWGFCGVTAGHCGAGCQRSFGRCN